ncbi:glycosyltransferase [Clostridium perfringens]|uniref:glycosyltransferase n=1 Tax=Clostridium perfringens TaxID=1502 RepID=UPI0018E4161B|nr:glycosyltransferase [Clostridium perfringens]MBI6040164.1 glycosyltransferase [Clostridium perfringens]MDM0483758.1 glycosyltransferase [Clostridium perfringens]
MNKRCVLHINTFNHGSTGNIIKQIGELSEKKGYNYYIAYPDSFSNNKLQQNNDIKIGNRIKRNLERQVAYFLGIDGKLCIKATKQLINKMEIIKPDIVHLHNLHNCYINLKLLFEYLNNNNIKVVWTLHDCWAFTGQCTHFASLECEKWKNGCYKCSNYKNYPKTLFDNSKYMYRLKEKIFTSLNNLTIVVPSIWLKKQVEKSFLNKYDTRVIYNGINLKKFSPIKSRFKKNNNLDGKKIILGVAYSWSNKKGLNIFLELSKIIDEQYIIVLVGLDEKLIKEILVNKKITNIIALPKTKTTKELVDIYSSADCFLNPSLQESMSLVTVEAMACGLPVIVSNKTALPELIDESCGIIVENYNAKSFYEAVINMESRFDSKNSIKRAQYFSDERNFNEYIELYNEILMINNY